MDTSGGDAMNPDAPPVELEDTLREATWRMSEQGVGAAVVDPAEAGSHPSIVTICEVLHSVGFSKIKSLLRRVQARTRESLIEAMGRALDAVTVRDARRFFRHCGYRPMDQLL